MSSFTSAVDEWYYKKSFGEHFAHMFFSPTSLVNPFFYHGLYESTQDDSTVEYVAEHLFYLSPWLPAAAYAGMSPLHLWSGGLSVMRYVAADAGLLTPAAKASVIVAGGIAVRELVGEKIPYQFEHDRIARARGQASARERPAWANLR